MKLVLFSSLILASTASAFATNHAITHEGMMNTPMEKNIMLPHTLTINDEIYVKVRMLESMMEDPAMMEHLKNMYMKNHHGGSDK